MPQTLYEKLWSSHVVRELGEGLALLYIDRQLVHEVSSPQAFEGLRVNGRSVRRPASHLAVADHAVPTKDRDRPIADPLARDQVALLARNTAEFGIRHLGLDDARQGIVHVIGPELGFTQPGMAIVCGDSHTSTHGAFGALAFGIGASECETVLATQTLRQTRAKTMRVRIGGALGPGRRSQGRDPSHRRQARRVGGGRLRYRIHRRGGAGPVDGRADDALQYVHRGGRAYGHDRAGRDHLRLSEGSAPRAQGRDVGAGAGLLEDASVRSGRRLRP